MKVYVFYILFIQSCYSNEIHYTSNWWQNINVSTLSLVKYLLLFDYALFVYFLFDYALFVYFLFDYALFVYFVKNIDFRK